MPTAAVNGIELAYEERGSGPPLLLIAGIPALGNDWWHFADALAGSRRVIVYDNRGSGESTVTPGPYSTAQLADDAVALLDHLQIERADVFGASLGGMIAQEVALARPERVRKLVLGCTHAGVAYAVRPPREAGQAFAMETDDWGERMRALVSFAFASDADPELLEHFTEKKSRDVQADEGYRGQIAAALGHDTYERLPQIEAPTLVLTGDDDRVIPAPSSDPLVERIPNARLHVVHGTGHLFFIEKPEETRAVLEDFLG
jgi:3-oxoadipate enol-lactonase